MSDCPPTGMTLEGNMNTERLVPGRKKARPRRVLLADDSEVVRKAIAVLLSDDPDIELVGEADTLAEAMRLASKLKPDIVIMDLHLDETMSPAKIKAHFSGMRLLAICVWTDAESQGLAYEYGALKLLGKGVLAAELIPTIKQEGAVQSPLAVDLQAEPRIGLP